MPFPIIQNSKIGLGNLWFFPWPPKNVLGKFLILPWPPNGNLNRTLHIKRTEYSSTFFFLLPKWVINDVSISTFHAKENISLWEWEENRKILNRDEQSNRWLIARKIESTKTDWLIYQIALLENLFMPFVYYLMSWSTKSMSKSTFLSWGQKKMTEISRLFKFSWIKICMKPRVYIN